MILKCSRVYEIISLSLESLNRSMRSMLIALLEKLLHLPFQGEWLGEFTASKGAKSILRHQTRMDCLPRPDAANDRHAEVGGRANRFLPIPWLIFGYIELATTHRFRSMSGRVNEELLWSRMD